MKSYFVKKDIIVGRKLHLFETAIRVILDRKMQ